jgi:hypothetical protein
MVFVKGNANEKGRGIENLGNENLPVESTPLGSFLIIARTILFDFPFWLAPSSPRLR